MANVWVVMLPVIFILAGANVPAHHSDDATCGGESRCLNDHYRHVAEHAPPVPEEDLAVVHSMVDSGAQGVKKSDSGIWFFDQLLRPEVVARVLERLPEPDSNEWTGCPRIEHNLKKRCFMLPINDDPLLKEVVTSFKAAWGDHLNTDEITHLAINRVKPGKAADELHADVFTGSPGKPRAGLERPTAHNIIYLTEQPSSSSNDQLANATKVQGKNLTSALSGWKSTKQWPARPQDDAKCGINIIYLTQQPAEVQPEQSGQLQFPRAGVTITPKAGAMISFAMTEDNDHFVGAFADNALADRISIQFPVSVFNQDTAKAYPEFVGNGYGPDPSPSPPAPPTPNPCRNHSTSCTYERGTAPDDGSWLDFNGDVTDNFHCCVYHRNYILDTWCEYDAVFIPHSKGQKYGPELPGPNCVIWKKGTYKWIPDPNGPHYRMVEAPHQSDRDVVV